MKRLLVLLLFFLPLGSQAQEGGQWSGPPSIALYTAQPLELTTQDLAQLAPEAQVEKLEGKSVPSYRVKWSDVEVIVNLGYEGDFAKHLEGMRGFVEAMSKESPEVGEKLLERVSSFKHGIGTQITPTFDKDGKAMDFVMALASRLKATLFTAASFYDTDGEPILYNGGPKRL